VIRVLHYSASDIFARPEVVARLRFLTNGGWGRHKIGSAMILDLKEERPGDYFLAWEDGVIVAWASLCDRPGYDSRLQFQCYTSAPHRRRGIGKRLLLKALKVAKNRHRSIVVVPWNQAGFQFYGTIVGLYCTGHWIPYEQPGTFRR